MSGFLILFILSQWLRLVFLIFIFHHNECVSNQFHNQIIHKTKEKNYAEYLQRFDWVFGLCPKKTGNHKSRTCACSQPKDNIKIKFFGESVEQKEYEDDCYGRNKSVLNYEIKSKIQYCAKYYAKTKSVEKHFEICNELVIHFFHRIPPWRLVMKNNNCLYLTGFLLFCQPY